MSRTDTVSRTTAWQRWLLTLVATVVLFGLLIQQLELGDLMTQLGRVPGLVWTVVVGCFTAEAALSTLRIQVCTSDVTSFRTALRVNGWYVAAVLVLPARLGEIAAIGVLRQATGLPLGAAAMSLVLQRILDVIGLILLASVWLMIAAEGQPLQMGIALAVTLGAGLLLVKLGRVLNGVAGRWLQVCGRRGWRGAVLVLILQARRWYRALDRRTYVQAVVLTVAKWLVTFTGIAMLIFALAQISVPEALSATSMFSLGSAIPLHGLGGIGAGEYTLATALLVHGLTIAQAAGVALTVRGFIILFGLSFFLTTRFVAMR